MIVLDPDGSLSWHLLAALRLCRQQMGDGYPRDLATLERILDAKIRQEPPTGCTSPTDDQDGSMSLLMTFGDVAQELRVSMRTAERLVGSGELPAINVGGRNRRVLRSDLLEYVESLRPS